MTHDIIAQFADEAAFLWVLRSRAIGEPHFSLDDLTRLDERLEAYIDGLRVAGDAAWEICKETLTGDCAEGIFAAAVLAFESGNETRIQDVMTAAWDDQAKAGCLISALGWLTFEQAKPHLEKFLGDESLFHQYIGIAASAIHRHDPGNHLSKAVSNIYPPLIARALRAYGELGRGRELDDYHLPNLLADSDDGIRFAAAWSASLAGIPAAVEALKGFVVTESPYSEKALNMALRKMEPTAALSWQKQLAETADTVRLATIGAGIIGDTALVPWLIAQMKTPALARVAGEAFTMITGVDIATEELNGVWPEGFEAGPNDDPHDDNVTLDADKNLPWPNAELIAAWWDRNQGTFQSSTRHLLGRPITADNLRNVLKTGLQRQRAAAALELSLMNPGQPLFEVRAPGYRQRAGVDNL